MFAIEAYYERYCPNISKLKGYPERSVHDSPQDNALKQAVTLFCHILS
jgi:hypothetical protein